MTTIVWSTESVDTSAMFLAQSFDDVLFTKATHERQNADDEITDALKDPENQVLFYGIVPVPDWFTERFFARERMFNDPRVTRALLKRNDFIESLGRHGVQGVRYFRVNDDTNYTRLRERIGRRFDLVAKPSMQVVATVDSADAFNQHRRAAHFARRHLNAVKKIRAFVGQPNVIDGGLIGASITEKRRLSFFETLVFGASAEARRHIQQQFDQGVLTEAMGGGREQVEAWTEQTHSTPGRLDEGLRASLRAVASAVHASYPTLDFCAIDLVGDQNGGLHVVNCTASPSLADDDVLGFVSDYYKSLVANGRVMTKDRLVRLVQQLTDEQVVNAARLLRREGVFAAA